MGIESQFKYKIPGMQANGRMKGGPEKRKAPSPGPFDRSFFFSDRDQKSTVVVWSASTVAFCDASKVMSSSVPGSSASASQVSATV